MSQDFCSNLFDPFERLHNIFNICTPWILQTNLWCIWGIYIQVTVEDSHTSSLSKYLQRLTEPLMFTLSKEQILSVSVSSAHLLRLRDRFESLDRDNRGYLRSVDALLTIIIQLNNNNYVFIGFVCFPPKKALPPISQSRENMKKQSFKILQTLNLKQHKTKQLCKVPKDVSRQPVETLCDLVKDQT